MLCSARDGRLREALVVYLRAQLLLGGLEEGAPGTLADVRALLEHSLQQPGFRWCAGPASTLCCWAYPDRSPHAHVTGIHAHWVAFVTMHAPTSALSAGHACARASCKRLCCVVVCQARGGPWQGHHIAPAAAVPAGAGCRAVPQSGCPAHQQRRLHARCWHSRGKARAGARIFTAVAATSWDGCAPLQRR